MPNSILFEKNNIEIESISKLITKPLKRRSNAMQSTTLLKKSSKQNHLKIDLVPKRREKNSWLKRPITFYNDAVSSIYLLCR